MIDLDRTEEILNCCPPQVVAETEDRIGSFGSSPKGALSGEQAEFLADPSLRKLPQRTQMTLVYVVACS